MLRVLPLLILLFIFFSCKEETPCNELEVSKGLIIEDVQLGTCFTFLDTNFVVIRNKTEYANLRSHIDSSDAGLTQITYEDLVCDSASLPSINFREYSLLGALADGIGCNIGFEREVSNHGNEYFYDITVHECGSCAYREYSMNWVLVPAIPSDADVIFNIYWPDTANQTDE